MEETSRKTGLKIGNSTPTKVSITVDQIENYDWDGVSRPDHNIHGRSIAPYESILEREEINYSAKSGSWFRLTFKFEDGRSFQQRFNQREALNNYYLNKQIHSVEGEEFHVTTTKIQYDDYPNCLLIHLDTKPLEETTYDLYSGSYPLEIKVLQHTYAFTKKGKQPYSFHNFNCYGEVDRNHYSIQYPADLELAIAIACKNPYNLKEKYDQKKITSFSQFGDCSGIVYGVTGVCHQMTNRILFACESHPEVFNFTPSAILSYYAYGLYGHAVLLPGYSNWTTYFAQCKQMVKNGRSSSQLADNDFMQTELLSIEKEITQELATVAAPMQTFSQKAIALEVQSIGDEDAPNKRLNLWITHSYPEGFNQNKKSRLMELNSEFHMEKMELQARLFDPENFKTLAELREFADLVNMKHQQMLNNFRDVLTGDEFRKICGLEYSSDIQLIDIKALMD